MSRAGEMTSFVKIFRFVQTNGVLPQPGLFVVAVFDFFAIQDLSSENQCWVDFGKLGVE